MKKFLLILLISVGSFSQEKNNQLDDKGMRHGLWKGIHEESKRPRYEGTFNHGKETGIFKYFDDTKAGKVIATRDFSKGDGSCYNTFFDQKGNKVSEGILVNKLHEGIWKFYHKESSDIMSIENYKNGKLNGVRKVFYKENVLAEETNYEDGMKNGVSKIYSENKAIQLECNYINDKLNGYYIAYNTKGEKIYEGKYKEGIKISIWKIYKNGKVYKEVKGHKFSREFLKFEEQTNRKKK